MEKTKVEKAKYMVEWRKKNKDRVKNINRKCYLKQRKKRLKEFKEYYKKNKQKYREWYFKNKNRISKRKRENYYSNPKKCIKRVRTWEKNNQEKFEKRRKNYYKLYRENNKDAINQKRKKRKVEDIEFNLKCRIGTLLRVAFKKYTKTGKIMSSKKYGIDYKAIIEHLKPFPKDLSKYHIDHIKPLCSFKFVNPDGSTNVEEIKKAFAPENHQWLLAEENIRKGGRH